MQTEKETQLDSNPRHLGHETLALSKTQLLN